ncbi:hypothetical protein [Nakamurella leprariae]|uniref:Thioredoxin domain-containing protein n=1 Tax=Nakamurella leprariae TaxID=2803911 RepID=A0A938YDJ2_9ACTN|nr:hypothetical protein [Nakamurella leprariae]MBM9468707.1 hypothetical protein [Nakamurella leprariae]
MTTTLLIVLFALVVVLAVLVVGLLRAYADVLRRLHALDGGSPGQGADRLPVGAPEFRMSAGVQDLPDPSRRAAATGSAAATKDVTGREAEWPPAHDLAGQTLGGEVVTVRAVGVEHDTVLVFLSSGCTGCASFWRDLARSGRSGVEALTGGLGSARLVVVTKGPDQESELLLADLCPPGIDLVMSTQAWDDYGVPGSPYVLVVNGRSGRVAGEGSGTSLTQVSGLIRQSVGDGGALGVGLASQAVRKPRSDTDREVDVDRALLAAGIGPGHPSLYGGDTTGPAADRTADQPGPRR